MDDRFWSHGFQSMAVKIPLYAAYKCLLYRSYGADIRCNNLAGDIPLRWSYLIDFRFSKKIKIFRSDGAKKRS